MRIFFIIKSSWRGGVLFKQIDRQTQQEYKLYIKYKECDVKIRSNQRQMATVTNR